MKDIEAEMATFTSNIAATIKKYFPEGIFGEVIGDAADARKKLTSIVGPELINSTIEQGKEWQKYAKKIVEAFADAWNIAVDGAELKVPGVEEIDEGLKKAQETLGHNVSNVQSEIQDAGSSFQAAAASAFSGLGQAIGDALTGDGDFGSKFLKLIGTFMVQFGSALIALGIAEAAWLQSFDPASKIIAGAALVIAGAVISNVASKKPGNNKGGGGQRSTTTATTTTPNSIQGFGGGSRLVAEVKGQDLRFVLQSANSNYNALN